MANGVVLFRGMVTTSGDVPIKVTDNGDGTFSLSVNDSGGGSAFSVQDEAAFIAGTSEGVPAMVVFDDVSPDTLAEGTQGIVRGTTNRAMHVNLRNASGAELGTATDPINVEGTVAVSSVGGTVTVTGTVAISGAVTVTGIGQQDNTAFTPGTTPATIIGGEVDDIGTVLATEGNAGAARITINRALHVNLRDTAGSQFGVQGTPFQVGQVDGAAFAPTLASFVPIGGEVDDTGTVGVAEGSAGSARITAQRAIHINLRDNAGVELGTTTTPVRVAGSLADNAAFTPGTTPVLPIAAEVDDTGTSAASENSAGALRMTVQRAMHINLRNVAGTEIGTSGAPVRVDPTNATPMQIVGNVAHDAADSGNPIKVGGIAYISDPSVVSGVDRVNAFFSTLGKQVVLPGAIGPALYQGALTSSITNTTSTQVLAAVASKYTYISSITITNSHATQGTFVNILSDTTVIYVAYCAAGGGGVAVSFPTPLRSHTTNVAINAQCVTTGADVRVAINGYTAAE